MRLSTFVLSAITISIQYYADKYREEDLAKTLDELEPDLNLPNIQIYDFIVVGGGTAGCLTAGRLSEHFNVLLLESGGDPVPATYNPYLNQNVFTHPAINNLFVSQKQLNFTQDSDGVVVTHTGRMLGGSGSHNGNVYNRGSPHDYDNYAALTGDESWSYENILKHFKSLEDFHGRLVNENERYDYYSTGGPLHVETDWPPILEGWFQSASELGYEIGDPNGYQKEGFCPMAKSMKNGERASTYTAFIKPFESKRDSLTVIRYSHVKNILIDAQKRAYGVAYLRHGMPQIARAIKEVIISCGVIQSPLLLIRSGIGPQSVLQEANIPITKVLEGVGQNFRDHVGVRLEFTATNPNLTLLPVVVENRIEKEINKFQRPQRSGLFTRMYAGPQALFVSSRAKLEGQWNWPDIQISFIQNQATLVKLDDNNGADKAQGLRMVTSLNRGKSSGSIGIDAANYERYQNDDVKLAKVDFKLLSDPSDRDVLIEGIKLAFKIIENTTTFVQMGVEYTESVPVPCSGIPYRSDEYWECYVAQRARSYVHAVGTCKMGVAEDPLAVVDSKLRVFGIQNLRVIDASVLPRTANTNTNAPVMLAAEKTSNDILFLYK